MPNLAQHLGCQAHNVAADAAANEAAAAAHADANVDPGHNPAAVVAAAGDFDADGPPVTAAGDAAGFDAAHLHLHAERRLR